jgi:hypothetical protein
MDNRVVVGIHQPNFMPWLGYFYKIWQSDKFIFLDDVQFIKTGSNYTNRVSINISGKSGYITIPIKRGSGIKNIDETEFLNEKWKKKIRGTLQANYAKSPYFNEHKDLIFELIEFKTNNLANYNINFIKAITKKLEFDTELIRSSKFNIKTKSTQRLVELIKKVDGEIYLSGKGGDKYQKQNIYKESNIEVAYNKMPNLKYNQPKVEKFISSLSIVDAIFNMGFENLKSHLFN